MAARTRARTLCDFLCVRHWRPHIGLRTLASAAHPARAVHTWDNFLRYALGRVYNEKRNPIWTLSYIQLHYHMVRITIRNRPTASLRAFTLIELLAVTAIIVVVSSVVLINNNRFGGVVQLENLTYDVALSVRQAQVYGISVQRSKEGDFSSAYGMHFSIDNPREYVLFADGGAKNGIYDDSSEDVSPYTIRSGFKVSDLCATSPQGSEACGISPLDIVFKRPEADAWISAGNNACSYGSGTCAVSARIVLKSPRNDMMSVLVGANGQISVQREASQ